MQLQIPLVNPTVRPRLCVLLLVLALAVAFSYTPASANGRAVLVSSQEKGPYRIDVSILPGQAVVADTHVSVLVLSLETQESLTDATVILFATGPDGSAELGPIPALNDVNPQFFETNLPFDRAGSWEIKVDVDSDLGAESIVFFLDVDDAGADINWILVAAGAVVILTVGIWIWDRVRGKKKVEDSS